MLGDGTLGEGALYEALGFAAWQDLPVLFFLEYNGWAMSTEAKAVERGDLAKRSEGFGVPFARTSDQDPVALTAHLRDVVERVRAGHPFFQVVDTRRLGAHSKGDDTRPATVIERLRREDPLSRWIAEQPWARHVEALPVGGFRTVFEAVMDGRAVGGVVPIENSIEGSVVS